MTGGGTCVLVERAVEMATPSPQRPAPTMTMWRDWWAGRGGGDGFRGLEWVDMMEYVKLGLNVGRANTRASVNGSRPCVVLVGSQRAANISCSLIRKPEMHSPWCTRNARPAYRPLQYCTRLLHTALSIHYAGYNIPNPATWVYS